ncbi:uncharacterized protein LOC130985751 [Salvia miltiorrhiza]|uniref:uncharacterized protein LOC130985751 n=1 Tax=Salvia miltiorrhiza TaxID=226208 RepID=UPI0025AC1AED|nr:uncharacterized protein LOC130985751 [Salvia miltiorrhiza]XP_057764843.1 uncharacterized protein LOC130985751 [Salvia miltiorrhiza]XP_057764844.1 uncharacterized protein LOC130985751 [Salvia miltiorrhiza]
MMADVSVAVRAKRKRGRPRKDSNLCSAGTLQSPENSSLMRNQGADQLLYPTPAAAADATKKCQDSEKNDEGMVGSMVYGVVEGSFDAGYLISVRIGNNLAPFRGVVFQPRKVVAVTAANDVAPQAKMYQRREIPVPVYEGQRATLQPPKQAVVRPPYADGKMVSKQFPYVHPTGNLRMVEEDEVMQAFEVSTSSGGSKSNLPNNGDATTNNQEPPSNLQNAAMAPQPSSALDEMMCRETMDQLQEMGQKRTSPPAMKVRQTNLFQDVNFHENLFSDHQPREQEQSPNLKLDLAYTVDKEKQMQMSEAQAQGNLYSVLNCNGMKNPNIGFHQALVAGNPLLLPPDLIGEPLEFMMDKPKTPPASQETNMEVQSRLGDANASASPSPSSYKLELATPHSPLNTRIADMDFVISNAMQQPAQSHTNN